MEGAARQHIGWIAAALALALVMRIWALWLAGDVPHYGDPQNYIRLATALGSGQGLVTPNPTGGFGAAALYPPGMPLLLAAVGLVLPLNAITLTLLNTLIDLAAALLLARVATLLGRRDLGIPVALAYLLWPSIAFMAPLAYKEGLVIALMLAMLVALLEQARRPGFRWALASGVAAGMLVLTQPGLAPLPALIFVALFKRFDNWSRWLAVSACAAGAALAVMLPWWARNAILFGEFIPLTTSSGLALWVGAQPDGGMVWKMPPPEWGLAGELGSSRLAAAEAWRIIADDPLGYVTRCLAKFPKSFFTTNWAIDQLVLAPDAPWPEGAKSRLARAGPTLIELGAALLALLGLYRFPRSTAALLLWACLAQSLMFGIWFEFSERHRLFMVPFILLLAAIAITRAHRRHATNGRHAL
ncbi:MAG: glycosyltransferase [Pseudomonadota bacterium]|nr:glycosyltransferase [Pseudomonadota bacterium]